MGTQKDKAWDYALGIIKVDGLEPSPEFLEQSYAFTFPCPIW
ncbi:antitoxin VbhA family protein [Desulfosporosinus lacus]|uniref:Uncharacterized protein n=1 Tax=Desulfosporosinus lacus DSM 15449 TaxID=1121420 RepID=A0A1M5XD87_9FIRM|nr:antitoxin VbhA family protein [Desulfosporosinus lacus]SHH97612.1 hypothetical protein SAMN02746098_01942 [Desulfosporosinus lacus DSM 15449]